MALNQVRVTGNDTIEIGLAKASLKPITSFADGDYARITFPNDIMNFTIGKNRNMIAAYNAMGTLAELELRLLRGSKEDAFLQSQFPDIASDNLRFNFIFAKVTKDLGASQGGGTVTPITESYALDNGVISKAPEIVSNVSGSTDQGVVIWQIKFAEFKRTVTGVDGNEIVSSTASAGEGAGEGEGEGG